MRSGPAKFDQFRKGQTWAQENLDELVLVVGEVTRWQAKGRNLPRAHNFQCVEIHEISAELIEVMQPQLVISPLLCDSFDCVDLAVLLDEVGFRGRYRAMSEDLPNPWLIRSEIQESCPGLDFDIVSLGVTDSHKVN